MNLSAGTHTITTFDSYANGWDNGGYWSIFDGCDTLIAGGSSAG